MSAEQLAHARELIKAKRYEEAHAILIHLDHPTAKQWLAKVEALLPAKPVPTTVQADDNVTAEEFDRFLEGEKQKTTTVEAVVEHSTNPFETLTTPALITTAKKPVAQSELVVEKVPAKSVRELARKLGVKTDEQVYEPIEGIEESHIVLNEISKKLGNISVALYSFIVSFLFSSIIIFSYINNTVIGYTPLMDYIFGSEYTDRDLSSLIFVVFTRFILTMGFSMPIIYLIGRLANEFQHWRKNPN